MTCKVCGQGSLAEGGVIDHPYRHPYIDSLLDADAGSAIKNKKKDKDESSPAAKAPAAVVAQGLGGDPVLRLALINAGVLSVAQLLAAEEELGNARASGRPAVASPPGAPDPEDRTPDPGFGLGQGVRSGNGGGP